MLKKEKQNEAPRIAPHLILDFVHALHRIFKIGNYYPPGHKAVDQAVGNFSIALKKIAKIKGTATIEIDDSSIHVEKFEVKTASKAKDELHQLLQEAGVESVRFERQITTKEILSFVQSFLVHRSRLKSVKQFTTAEIANTPKSIKVTTKQFLVDQSTIVEGYTKEESKQQLEEVFDRLNEEGLSEYQVNQCRNLLNSLARNFKIKQNAKGRTPNFTWNDVQRLLLKVFSHSFDPTTDLPSTSTHYNVNALSTILSQLEIDSEDNRAQESIDLLLSLIKTKDPVATEEEQHKPKRRRADAAPPMTVVDIQKFINEKKLSSSILYRISKADKSEEIAILLQLLQHEQTSEAHDNCRSFFRNFLSTPLNKNEWKTLLAGIKHFFDLENFIRLKDILPLLALQLRSSKSTSSIRFFLELSKLLSRKDFLLLWPTLANELISVGVEEDQKAYIKLARRVSTLSPKEMLDNADALFALDGFQEKNIASNIFLPKEKDSYLFFAFLLNTDLKKDFYNSILPVLQKSPPDWLGEVTLPMMGNEEQHIKFLQLYLANIHQMEPPAILKQFAGKLLVEHIPEIPEQKRTDPWVIQAIEACGKLPVDGMHEMLTSIANQKKMFFLHDWDTEYRTAALKALKQLPSGR